MKKIKINMGCGWRNFGKDWIHIDGGNYEHLDFYNIEKLHFDDNTVDLIYASHVVEYFDKQKAKLILQEWNRVLKPGATIRIAVPNFQSIAELYLNHNYMLNNFLGPLYGKMKMGNETIYHKTIYDFVTLEKLLIDCGYSQVKKYDWRDTEHAHFDDHSQAYIPHMDKENGTLISLNVEGKK